MQDQPRGHRRKALVAICPTPNVTIPNKPVGCGGAAPSPSLGILGPPPAAAVPATAMVPSPRDPRYARVPYGAVAPGDPCDSTGGGPPPFPITLLASGMGFLVR